MFMNQFMLIQRHCNPTTFVSNFDVLFPHRNNSVNLGGMLFLPTDAVWGTLMSHLNLSRAQGVLGIDYTFLSL